MSYTRPGESGHYIWCSEDAIDFDCTIVEDDAVDVFLYKLYELRSGKNEEFWKRHAHGKRIIENYAKGICIQKITKHTEDLEEKTASIAVLAGEIWREHFTSVIGAAQVEYMLQKFQSAERIYEDMGKNGYVYFTAASVDGNELLGYCSATPKERYLLLSKLYVRKNVRGRGVARSFLNEVIALCLMEYGLDKIRLTVNKNNDSAVSVYQTCGFKTVDSVKTDIGEGFFMDDYVMELAVPDTEAGCGKALRWRA